MKILIECEDFDVNKTKIKVDGKVVKYINFLEFFMDKGDVCGMPYIRLVFDKQFKNGPGYRFNVRANQDERYGAINKLKLEMLNNGSK